MILNQTDLLNVERELCSRSLGAFARRAWHVLEPATTLEWGWVLDAICLHLEAVTRGDITRLLINVPPGTMKSLLVGVFWPAWEWGAKDLPHMRYVGTAHEETLAIRDSRKCRDLIKSKWYQARWPVSLLRSLDGKREFGNDKTGVRQARAFTSMTGVRGDRVILDDPISADSANSPAKLLAAETAFLETLPTRVNNEFSAIVVVMQRLNEKDTSGVILEKDLAYVHLFIPMRYEAGRVCTTNIGWTDPRTIEGELMFPDRFSDEQVLELEKTLGSYGTAGQLQQRPSPRGGGLFRGEWWKFYTELPEITYRVITADTAQKTKEQNDFSVLQCWGATIDGRAALIDQIRGKWESPELKRRTVAFWEKHKAVRLSPLRALYVEDKSSGTGLIQDLKHKGIPILPIQRNTDKISRAYDVSPFIESGNVLLPKHAEWLSDYLSEFDKFPNGLHDDQIDPTMDGISKILQPKAQPRVRML